MILKVSLIFYKNVIFCFRPLLIQKTMNISKSICMDLLFLNRLRNILAEFNLLKGKFNNTPLYYSYCYYLGIRFTEIGYQGTSNNRPIKNANLLHNLFLTLTFALMLNSVKKY